MKNSKWIEINELSTIYKVEVSFFYQINDLGIVKIVSNNNQNVLSYDDIDLIEKAVRLHHDLNVNLEGIDVIFNLLSRIDALNHELKNTKRQLGVHI